MTPAEILLRARGFLAQGWTQSYYAKNTAGDGVGPSDPAAVCWCMAGALHIGAGCIAQRRDALNFLHGVIGRVSLSDYNDAPGRTQAEVLAVFDQAIAAAQAAGQ